MENLIGMMLGWPSLIVALCLAVAGVWRRTPSLLWVAAVLSLPVAMYVSATPVLPFVGVVPLAALSVAALACRRQNRMPATFAVGIFTACLGGLGWVASVD